MADSAPGPPSAPAPPDGQASGAARAGASRTELPDVLLVVVLSLALVGYVYAIGWVIACVHLAAVRLPVSFSLPSIASAANFATGAHAVLVMAIVFAVMCAFAYAVHFGRWNQHADAWREIVEDNRSSAREHYLRRGPLKPKPPKAVRAQRASGSENALVRVIAGSFYNFDGPDAEALAAGHLFVANAGGNSVTELNASTGALLGVISGPAYRFNTPGAMALSGRRAGVRGSVGAPQLAVE